MGRPAQQCTGRSLVKVAPHLMALLRPFPLAHPWLIYTELMYSSDLRAHEAAEELKREFLT